MFMLLYLVLFGELPDKILLFAGEGIKPRVKCAEGVHFMNFPVAVKGPEG